VSFDSISCYVVVVVVDVVVVIVTVVGVVGVIVVVPFAVRFESVAVAITRLVKISLFSKTGFSHPAARESIMN
jgi:hypothetical protein